MTEPIGSSRPLMILLAEDSEADAKIAVRAFKTTGVPNTVTVVRNGHEALDFIYGRSGYSDRVQCPRPDILLLDLNMPRVDGFAVIDALKSDPAMKEIPIVVLTTSRNAGDVLRAYKAGAVSYIPKPVEYSEFVRIIGGFCDYWWRVSLLPGRAQ